MFSLEDLKVGETSSTLKNFRLEGTILSAQPHCMGMRSLLRKINRKDEAKEAGCGAKEAGFGDSESGQKGEMKEGG